VIDLNLVRTFVTIYETGSISAAADRLHVSQPSVSYTLKRLRDLLGEPLFKRTREGVVPTFFATQLYEKFRKAVSEIEGAVESTRKFDPHLSSRRFRLAMSDIGETTFLPLIMAALAKIAPDVGIDIVAVDVTKLAEWLSTGKIDAVLSNRGYVPTASAGEVIFTDHYVCVASSRHPRLSSELTMEHIWPNDMFWSLRKAVTVWSRSDCKNSVTPAGSRLACRISACCRTLSRPRISCSRFPHELPTGLPPNMPSEFSIFRSRCAKSTSCCDGKSTAAISLPSAGSAKFCGNA
jgi:DNA-binding transcriptional LysR family regulator